MVEEFGGGGAVLDTVSRGTTEVGFGNAAAAGNVRRMKFPVGLAVALGTVLLPAAEPFQLGADVSALPIVERHGGRFTLGGEEREGLALLRGAGANAFRLRLFANPQPRGIVDNSLDYTLALARRVKATGAALLLDFHYSDTWADPQKQFTPAAWSGLDVEELAAAVHAYTRHVLARFEHEGLRPDFVHLGNEITNGFLWPTGRLSWTKEADAEAEWARFTRLLRAAVEAVPRGPGQPRIILHIESGGQLEKSRTWLRRVAAAGLEFDEIGLSYYPDWHGDLATFRRNLAALAAEFGRPVQVVETAYPWRPVPFFAGKRAMDWPQTPEGQAQFLRDVVEAVRAVPDGRGRGVWYWHPESIPAPGLRAWHQGACALFDERGEALPGVGALFGGGPR